MKRKRSMHWLLVAALGFGIPCALRADEPTNQVPTAVVVSSDPTNMAPRSAELTNQAPSSASGEKIKEVETDKQTPPLQPATPARARIVYKLPLRGAPAVRIDGGSRGSGLSLICLNVLTPDSTALTVQEQPSLFWYQSQPADVVCEVTLLRYNTAEPLLRVRLPNAKKAGIQRLNLSEHNVKLATGIDYEWVVALVVDPESRSKDVVARGSIQRVEASPMLKSRLAAVAREDLPFLYAEEGIWLDAVTTLSDLIEARPLDKSLQNERSSLLQQVGLTNAAAYAASRTGNN